MSSPILPKIVCIAGNIGAGKSTIGKLLADHLTATFYQESLDNDLLQMFIDDSSNYAFAFQLYMLTRRQLNYALALKSDEISIIERSLSCDKVFAGLQHKRGFISDKEFAVYNNIYDSFIKFCPDVIVYLNVDIETAMERISKRARDGESAYTKEYLEMLTKQYEESMEELEKAGIRIVRVDWNDNVDMNSEEEKLLAIRKLLDAIV